MYTKNLKDWTILNALPSNGYKYAAPKSNFAVVGGSGIMIRIVQNN